MALTVTAGAAKFMQRMIRFCGAGEQAGFRLVVTPGGCSGLNSEFSVEATPRGGDAVVEHSGVRLFLPAQSRMLLEGATIDFVDTPMNSGLVFLDARSSCACGSAPAGVGTVSVGSIGRR